jgi:secreted trypsin-like serine protease
MPDYEKLLQELAELRAHIARLESQVSQLQQSEAAAPGAPTAQPSALATHAESNQPGDSENFIPPLLVDELEPILGGTLTDGFPDCCAVGNEFMGYFCTGTLIAPNLVLTAKHCGQQFNVKRVFLKGNDVNKPEKGETINVEKVHENPNPKIDLMILVLEQPSKVAACRIAKGATAKAKTALVVGFGTINPGGTKGYGKKRKARVPIMTLECGQVDEQAEYGCYADIEMVAGHRGLKKDTCKGDSGGPLYVEDDEGGYRLLGVTSRGVQASGKPCGNGGIYVRADKVTDWIRDKTGVQL